MRYFVRQTQRSFARLTTAIAMATMLGLLASVSRAQPPVELPDGVTRTPVDIWSEGTCMAGDLYRPRAETGEGLLPPIVMSHG